MWFVAAGFGDFVSVLLAGYLVCWLVVWLVGCVDGWVSRSVGWLSGWLVGSCMTTENYQNQESNGKHNTVATLASKQVPLNDLQSAQSVGKQSTADQNR